MTLIRMLSFKPMDSKPEKLKQVGEKKNKSESVQQTNPKTQKANTNAPLNKWEETIESMRLDGLTRELASQCIVKDINEQKLMLAIAPIHQQFLSTAQKDRLIAALKTHYGEQLRVEINIEEFNEETPSAKRAREAKENHESAVEGFITDPAVKAMVDTFDGTLNEDSIHGREAQ